MNWFPLPLFPEGSLASSIVTTVWVGVLVFSFMNLRFGWVFSGLVVPGYLVPLLIVKPWSAAIIGVEAVITLWTVQGLSKLMARSGIACEFFGRDRFLALLMVSAFYRILADVWLLPIIGERLTTQFGIAFDYRNNLQSFGLIVICLAANQLWKTGVVRGALPFIFNICITYVIVRYGLMELTNFSITNLSYLYEDMATSVHAAPKAYIILITTAIFASRMNLIYGWDFNGILIPALIALQWYEPIKVLTSFVEAVVILLIAIQVLKLPIFRSITVEGSRKFLIFFTISFFYKMAIGWALFFLEPSAKVSDYYGFGYLLPTLMAIKMHQHGKVWHQLRITAQVSLYSVAIANVIGFSLTLLPLPEKASDEIQLSGEIRAIQNYDESQLEVEAYRSFINSYVSILQPEIKHEPTPQEIQRFEYGLKNLLLSPESEGNGEYIAALRDLNTSGFEVNKLGERYFRLAPLNPASGRPFLFIDRQSNSGLTVSCHDALDERHLFDASLTIFNEQSAGILSFGGQDRKTYNWTASAHQVRHPKGGVVEVCRAPIPGANYLYIKGSIPESLKLGQLEERFGKFTARWEDSNRINLWRDQSTGNYSEFHLDHQLQNSESVSDGLRETAEPIDAVIRRVCYRFAPRASGLYKAPTREELLHIDRHILEPLFNLHTGSAKSELTAIEAAALVYGYEVTALRREEEAFILLSEPDPQLHWGSVLVRVSDPDSQTAGLCFEVPSRVRDHSIISFASTQFRRFGAQALIIAGTNTLTNSDATSKLTVASNRDSFFNLAHQAFCRSRTTTLGIAPLVIQCRAYLPPLGEKYPEGDLIVSPYFGNFPVDSINAALAPLRSAFRQEGVEIASMAYDDATSPYAPGFNIQARYMDFTHRGTFALFWLSPFLRENYELQEENFPVHKMVKAVGIPISETPLLKWLENRSFKNPGSNQELFKKELCAFREKHDIGILRALTKDPGSEIHAILDPASSQMFFALLTNEDRIALLANLARNAPDRSIQAGPEFVPTFVDTRAAWMEQILPETAK